MYALSFDMNVAKLRKNYGEPYNRAYYDVRELLSALVKTVMQLSKIGWFKNSVRDIRGFKIEDWSDFTEIVKNE